MLLVDLLLAGSLDLLLAELFYWLLVDMILHGMLLVELLLCGILIELLLFRLLVDLILRGLLVDFKFWLLVILLWLGWMSVNLALCLDRPMQDGPCVLIEWLLGVGNLLLVGLVSYTLLRSVAAIGLHSKQTTSA